MPRLYIGNLPYSATEQDVIAAFAELGVEATNVHLPKDRESGQARGFGFVEVPSDPQAAISILDGNRVLGRVLRVDVAQERQAGGGGGGGSRPAGGAGGPPPAKGHWDKDSGDRRRRD